MENNGFVSKFKNQFSKKKYLISTAYDKKGYWSSGVFTINLLGIPDLFHPLVSIIRNNQDEAKNVHSQLARIVETFPEIEWSKHIPQTEPPEGFNEKTTKVIENKFSQIISKFTKLAQLRQNTNLTNLFAESKMPAPKIVIQEALKDRMSKLLNYLKGDINPELRSLSEALLKDARNLYCYTADIVPDGDAELVNNIPNAGWNRVNYKQFRDKLPKITDSLEKNSEILQKVQDESKKLMKQIDQFIKDRR